MDRNRLHAGGYRGDRHDTSRFDGSSGFTVVRRDADDAGAALVLVPGVRECRHDAGGFACRRAGAGRGIPAAIRSGFLAPGNSPT